MNSKDIYTSFIIEIINERKKRGITQVELAKMIGVPQSTIGRMENLSHFPKLDTICKILFVLNKYPKLVELQYTIDKSIIKKQIDLWDPINLLSFCPSDEYDSEINHIYEKINVNKLNELNLGKIIYDTFKMYFEEDFNKSINDCIEIAKEIINYEEKS